MVVSAIVDTSVIVDYLRGYTLARQWFTNQQRAHLGITPIVWLEAVQGAANKIERDRAVRFLRQFYMEHPSLMTIVGQCDSSLNLD